jgi:hypothetical protein
MKDWILAVCFALTLVAPGCKGKPIPLEVRETELQEKTLWRAGAHFYATEEYENYQKSLREAKDKLIKEKAKLPLLKDYREVQVSFQNILSTGEDLLKKVEDQKRRRSEGVTNQIAAFTKRIDNVKKLSRMINQGRFARSLLIRTELKLREADLQHKKGEIIEAEKKLAELTPYLQDSEDLVFSILERYRDPSYLNRWEGWIKETISESEKNRIFAVVVTKIDRKLIIYKEGKPFVSFDVGLGPNSLADKIHAGDYATPEGRYKIAKKIPTSQFHKALLLDYPNEEDKKRFQQQQQEGLIPPGVGIGGLIEIHGGGDDSITNGCISLEDENMDRLFDLLDIGTPVIIVGSTRRKNEAFFGHKN